MNKVVDHTVKVGHSDDFMDYYDFSMLFSQPKTGRKDKQASQRKEGNHHKQGKIKKSTKDERLPPIESGQTSSSYPPNHFLFGQMEERPRRDMKRGRLRRNGVKSAPASSSIIDLLLGSPLQPQHYKQQVNNAVSRPRPRRGRMGEESNENRFLATKLPDYDGAYAASSPQNNLGSLSIGQADTEMQECEQVKEEDIVVKLLRMIMVREDYLEHLRLANHVFKGNEKVWRELLDLLLFLRKVSLHIVSLLDYWKEHLERKFGPFVWHHQTNYLIKMTTDTDFLADIPHLQEHLGISLRNNPFFANFLIDGSYAREGFDGGKPVTTVIDPLTNTADVRTKLRIQRACKVMRAGLPRQKKSTQGLIAEASPKPTSAPAKNVLYAQGNPNYPPGRAQQHQHEIGRLTPPVLDTKALKNNPLPPGLDEEDEHALEIACLLGNNAKLATSTHDLDDGQPQTGPTSPTPSAVQFLGRQDAPTSPCLQQAPSQNRPSPCKASELLGLAVSSKEHPKSLRTPQLVSSPTRQRNPRLAFSPFHGRGRASPFGKIKSHSPQRTKCPQRLIPKPTLSLEEPEDLQICDFANINEYLDQNLISIKQMEQEHLLRRRGILFPAFRAWFRVTKINRCLRSKYTTVRKDLLESTFGAWSRLASCHRKAARVACFHAALEQQASLQHWLRMTEIRHSIRHKFYCWKSYLAEKRAEQLAIVHYQHRLRRHYGNYYRRWKAYYNRFATEREAVVFWKLRTLLGTKHRGAIQTWIEKTRLSLAYKSGEIKEKQLLKLKAHRGLATWRRQTIRNLLAKIMTKQHEQKQMVLALKTMKKFGKISLYVERRRVGMIRPKTVYAQHVLGDTFGKWAIYYKLRVLIQTILIAWEHNKTKQAFKKWRKLYGPSKNPFVAAVSRTGRSLWPKLSNALGGAASKRPSTNSMKKGVEAQLLVEQAMKQQKQRKSLSPFMASQKVAPLSYVGETGDSNIPTTIPESSEHEGDVLVHNCPSCRLRQARLEQTRAAGNSTSPSSTRPNLSITTSVSPVRGTERPKSPSDPSMGTKALETNSNNHDITLETVLRLPSIKKALTGTRLAAVRTRNSITIQRVWRGYRTRSNLIKEAKAKAASLKARDSVTNLVLAVETANLDEVKRLLAIKSLLKAIAGNEATLWSQAVLGSSEHAVDVIRTLASHMDLNILDYEGRSPLMVCLAFNKKPDLLVAAFLEFGASLWYQSSTTGSTAFHLAVQNGHVKACELLALEDQRRGEQIINVADFDANTPFHIAVRLSAYTTVAALLKHESLQIHAVNQQGQCPLCIAVVAKDHSMVEMLLRRGADPRVGGTLLSVIDGEDKEMLEILITSYDGYYVNAQDYPLGNTLLHWSVIKHSSDMVLRLLQAGADPELVNWEGLSPKVLSRAYDFQEMPKLLVQVGYPPEPELATSPP